MNLQRLLNWLERRDEADMELAAPRFAGRLHWLLNLVDGEGGWSRFPRPAPLDPPADEAADDAADLPAAAPVGDATSPGAIAPAEPDVRHYRIIQYGPLDLGTIVSLDASDGAQAGDFPFPLPLFADPREAAAGRADLLQPSGLVAVIGRPDPGEGPSDPPAGNEAGFAAFLAEAASGLGAGGALLFAPEAHDHAGPAFLIVDGDGQAGFRPGEDFIVQLGGPPPLDGLPGELVI